MIIERVSSRHVGGAIALLDELRVSLFGISSHRLHVALVRDAVAGIIDGRVAVDDHTVNGIVLAAAASYWQWALTRHWLVAAECIVARAAQTVARSTHAAIRVHDGTAVAFRRLSGVPRVTWAEPRDAFRIIIVGTAQAARGRGVGRELYRSLMADRSLVARIAADNAASIRLHESLGWRIYPDGPVLLAVHRRGAADYSADAAAG